MNLSNIKTAFETKLIVSTVMIMVFKELLTFTGVIEDCWIFEKSPIHPAVIFLWYCNRNFSIAGSTGNFSFTLCTCFATIPNGGTLMILLMCMTYIAMQVSPHYICLAI